MILTASAVTKVVPVMVLLCNEPQFVGAERAPSAILFYILWRLTGLDGSAVGAYVYYSSVWLGFKSYFTGRVAGIYAGAGNIVRNP